MFLILFNTCVLSWIKEGSSKINDLMKKWTNWEAGSVIDSVGVCLSIHFYVCVCVCVCVCIHVWSCVHAYTCMRQLLGGTQTDWINLLIKTAESALSLSPWWRWWRTGCWPNCWPSWILCLTRSTWGRGSVFNCYFIYFGPVFSHCTVWALRLCRYCCRTVPLAALFFFSFLFLQTQPDVTSRCTPHTVSGVCSLAPTP